MCECVYMCECACVCVRVSDPLYRNGQTKTVVPLRRYQGLRRRILSFVVLILDFCLFFGSFSYNLPKSNLLCRQSPHFGWTGVSRPDLPFVGPGLSRDFTGSGTSSHRAYETSGGSGPRTVDTGAVVPTVATAVRTDLGRIKTCSRDREREFRRHCGVPGQSPGRDGSHRGSSSHSRPGSRRGPWS